MPGAGGRKGCGIPANKCPVSDVSSLRCLGSWAVGAGGGVGVLDLAPRRKGQDGDTVLGDVEAQIIARAGSEEAIHLLLR